MSIALGVARVFDLINLLLIASILLTWFPNIRWHNEPFRSLRIFSEFFLAPFRKIIPPIGMIDISPIAALFCLVLLRHVIVYLLLLLGL